MAEGDMAAGEGGAAVPVRRILPPRGFLAALLVLAALHALVPVAALPTPPVLRAAGALIVLLAILLAFAAAGRFARVGTGIVPFSEATALVTEGPFRFSRNPMYLSMVAALAGLALAAGSLSVWVVPVAFWFWLRQAFVRHEERFMAARFGADYADYTSQVRRWL